MNEALRERVLEWIVGGPDVDDRETLQSLLDHGDEVELHRRFDVPLTFGTAGLRGPEMAGPAGMNRYTVRRATQGVIAWMGEIGADPARGVVVGRDGRHGSESFNHEVVSVLLGAGVKVYEMPGPLPTPLVAYCVTALGAAAGIMVTASHNPPQDNGYKLYSSDGSQIVPPNDEIVERFANAAATPPLGERTSTHHRWISQGVLDQYRAHMTQRFAVTASDLAITYTPLHGVGGATMMDLFARAGYSNVTPVAAQFEPDGAFPTLPFPNPEEPGALDLAMARADEVSSDLVIANDPDADRLGAAARDASGWHVLRGDQIGWLLASAMLPTMQDPRDVVATTIVSSTLLRDMARDAGVRFAMTLTGFKWLARAAGDGVLRLGYEEALGFAVDPEVADKDGLSAALALAQLANELRGRGETLMDRLNEIEARFGVHSIFQLSLRAEGPTGLRAIVDAVQSLRERPPTTLGGIGVSAHYDLALGYEGLGPTDGVLLQLGESGRVVVRPSGTEPKLKAYIEITSPPSDATSLTDQRRHGESLVAAVRGDLESLLRL
ncbi:MAG TPA: phospho-sugar mutase [Acidimicrobiales bacterium]|nr:phospho-sugar mutase [Acidimicrobiales bacterium]